MSDGGQIEPADVEDEALAVERTTMVLDMDDDDEDAVDPNSSEYRAAHDFLSAIWGADTKGMPEGVHFVAEKKVTKGLLHFPVTGISSAVSLSFNRSGVGQTTYFACSRFATYNGTNYGNRTQANALGAHGFWLDVDCGTDKPYLSQIDGAEALKKFCKAAGLSKPSIVVDSGHGLHCYWHFDLFICKATWEPLAKALADLAAHHKFHVDTTRTQDIASVLRLPGTMNYKDRHKSRVVTICHFGPPLDFQRFAASLQTHTPPPPPTAAALPAPSQAASATNTQAHPPSSAYEIIKRCGTLAHFEAVGGAVSEPLWRLALGVLKYTVEGEPLAHQWSMGDPRYDQAETQEKLDKWTKPPALCATFRNIHDAKCAGCTQTCRSPIRLGSITADPVEEMNWRYFVSKVGGNVFVFDEQDADILAGGMSFTSFRNLHSNKFANGKPLAGQWLLSPNRREYDRLIFDPSQAATPNCFNLWRGMSVEPTKGDYHAVLRHILFVWCGGKRDQFKYVLRWMALAVQKPWIKPEVALVLRSKQGSGKGIVVDMFRSIFGTHGYVTSQKEQVAGRFNGHLLDKVLIVFEEAFFAGDPAAVAAAKVLITNPHIGYEAKGKDGFSARNFAKVIILTNSDWAVPAAEDARRYAVLDVSDVRAGDHEYFLNLAEKIQNGGTAAFLDFLLRVDLTGFNPRKLPTTNAMMGQRVQTMLHSDPVGAWWLSVLSDGEFGLKGGAVPWGRRIAVTDLQDSYEFGTVGARYRPPFAVAAKALRRLVPPGGLTKHRKAQTGANRYFEYVLPSLSAARAHFQLVTGIDPCTP